MASTRGVCVELHMAKSMEDLNKKINTTNFDCSTPKLLGRSSNKLFLAAKDAAFQKDEEKSYVLFMRFLELVRKIRSSKEYKIKKAEFDNLIPGQKIQSALKEAERLSESLRERYSTPQGKRQKLDSVDQSQGEGVMDQEVPNDDNVDHNKPLSAAELYKQNSGIALVPQQPSTIPTETGVAENGFVTDTPSPPSMMVTPQHLFALLKSSPNDVIVLDCRPRSMFLASHPDGKKYPQWLSVPEELIKKGVTYESLERFLRGKGRKMWTERANKIAIVLVDCGSTSSEVSSDTGLPLVQLRDAIHKYDTAVELPRPPVYLEGGYTQWYLHYSPVCVGMWRWNEGVNDSGREGGQRRGDGRDRVEDNGHSFDYPTFPEISEPEETPETTQETPVAMEEAVPIPSSGPAHPQGEISPSAPPILTNCTPLPHPPQSIPNQAPLPHPVQSNPNHTHLPHPQPSIVPAPVYEPPPVMTILSLDDPNLDQDDAVIQLSTMPDNRVDQFVNSQQNTAVHASQLQGHHGVAQPILQSAQSVSQAQFVAGPETVQQHLQTGQQYGTYQEMGQGPVQSGHTPHAYPQTGQTYAVTEHPAQFDGQTTMQYPGAPQFGVQPSHTQIVHPQQPTMQSNGLNNPLIMHSDPQSGQFDPVNVQAAPQVQQLHPQMVQPTFQSGHQSTPQLGQPNPQIAHQTVPDSIPNQRVVYGPIPNPPGYDQAVQLPSQPPVQPPIPPPMSLGPHPHTQHNQINPFQNQHNVPHSNQAGPISGPVDHSTMVQHNQHHMPAQYQDGTNQSAPVPNQFQNQPQPPPTNIIQQPPPTQPPHVNIDPSAAKIQELERIIHMREREEIAWREREEKVKADLEQEKQRWEESKQRESQKLERQRLALAQEAATITKGKEELDRMRLQVEEETKRSVKESEQLRQLLRVQESGQKDQRKFAVNQGLPAGWEKRLDRTTGRFFYVDHNSKTTHWNPPANWLDYQTQMQQKMREGGQIVGVPDQTSGLSSHHRGVPQTSQLPPQQQRVAQANIMQPNIVPTPQISSNQAPPPQQREIQQPIRSLQPPPKVDNSHPQSHPKTDQPVLKQATVPSVDRSNKPLITPSVDRSSKPAMTPAMHKKKLNTLQPMYGSQGYGLTGLRNLGNTCFMNSTLQCLCATSPFVSHFLPGTYLKDRNRSNPLGHRGVLADEFSFLMKSMWSGQYRFISPRDFKDAISHFAPTFSGTQQHDSQEFLAFLLDGLHEDMNRVVERRYIENPDYSRYNDREAANIAWSLHKKRNDSIIVDLFQGQFRSTLRCLECQNRSVNFEAFMYLSVPLPPGNNPCSLKECIKLFTKEERVTGDDKWYCSSCEKHQDASKKIEIWKLPSILLIHLKRFSYEGVWRQKKQNFVDFPFTGLDMSGDVVGERGNLRDYKLFGVSNHFGTLSGGHYTAFCLNAYKKRFYNFDDHEIKEVPQRQVKSSAAYLLFYTSMDLSPPKMF